jgi:hypothetical protein
MDKECYREDNNNDDKKRFFGFFFNLLTPWGLLALIFS